jgi:hypothetical protein
MTLLLAMNLGFGWGGGVSPSVTLFRRAHGTIETETKVRGSVSTGTKVKSDISPEVIVKGGIDYAE